MSADIASLDDVVTWLENIKRGNPRPTIAVTSGGYAPIHPGHISVFERAKFEVSKHRKGFAGIVLIVLVNGDEFLRKKVGFVFQPLEVRCKVVATNREIDVVVPFNPSRLDDMTVCEALEKLRPDYFLKGGDRVAGNTPEGELCEKLGINVLYGVGEEKRWSSSGFLANHRKYLEYGV